MQHYILRCKHCHKEYTYCTYGNGPEYGTEFGCSMDYCAECQSAINNALKNIPSKFESRFFEIKQNGLLPVFEKIRKKEKEKNAWPNFCSLDNYTNYDNTEIYIHNKRKFLVGWDDKTPENKHIFISMEYDLQKNDFTGKPWHYNADDSYTKFRNPIRCLQRQSIKLQPLAPPIGELFFHDFEWTVETRKTNENKITSPKTHELKTWSTILLGSNIKTMLNKGWLEKKCKFKNPTLLKDDIIDYLDYNIKVEEYDDEDFITIVNIENV